MSEDPVRGLAGDRAQARADGETREEDRRRRVLAIVARYVSPITARSVVDRLLRDTPLRRPDVAALARALSSALRIFVDEATRTGLEAELRSALEVAPVVATTIAIESDGDVLRARLAARRISEDLGASTLVAQKVATAASELTRNIVMYAGKGSLEIAPVTSPRRGIRLVARDEGPGIANPGAVLAGTYRSRTGLGAGLRGAKRLADRFHLDTSTKGTVVEFEAWL
jgi:serine/threonine-protein kinase RsbT